METVTTNIPSAELWRTVEGREVLERKILPSYIPTCRWFGGKARGVERFELSALASISPADEKTRLAFVKAAYADGSSEIYLLPLRIVASGERRPESSPDVLVRFEDGAVLIEAIHDESFRAELFRLMVIEGQAPADDGAVIAGIRGKALPAENLPSRVLMAEQSNSSMIFGDQVFLKLFRKLQEGLNPDVEITRFLSERQGFRHIPPFAGAIEFRRPGRLPQVLALAIGLVPNRGDAWVFTLGEAGRFYERFLADEMPAAKATGYFRPFLDRARQLGQRTGAMHCALAADSADPDFAPERLSAEDQLAVSRAVVASVDRLPTSLHRVGGSTDQLVDQLQNALPELRKRAVDIGAHPVESVKIRTHGDYHLGQVLETGGDFVIIDFEGEPLRSMAERREKRSPLRDVAGMQRSFHYAAHSALDRFGAARAELEPWAERWSQAVSREFLQGWIDATRGAAFVPKTQEDLTRLLDAFLLEKAVYEVFYELNNRPTWVGIPIRGILQILAARRSS